MEYADIAIAVLGVLGLASIWDLLSGRRGYGGAVLVAGVGAACGAFLVIRVFGISTLGDWLWVAWAMVASAFTLLAYTLFRSKR
ncbi:transglycosylase [Brevundimonas variabilis]|uniref:Transglycosylase n=1 Tax=Brevundimonas variabilis TaxID=74312 RepID=A0A7W9CH25_9CAUL|nr:transglycosylase [Brevundimonas variabilis]MBB5745524.1 hypothetical protein [Brevundimonas variabilis]